MTVDEILNAGASTFRQRNALYGDTHKQIGSVLHALFPDGIKTIESCVPQQMNRLFLIIQCANKLTRYASLLFEGGHKDSAHDLMVYAAMLEAITNETPGILAAPSDAARTGQAPQTHQEG